MKFKRKSNYILGIYLLLYFIISFSYLEIFPFVHSDEPWLSGLTRNMIESKSLFCTETFFNLYPRYPHSIKVIFHLLQMPFILLFGYKIVSVRLLSLLFAICSLILFYNICTKLFKNNLYSLLLTILLSLNIQFIYASHFARQEIILVFFFMLGLFHYLQYISNKYNPHMILGLIIGLSIGIHPNSFILALVFGLLYIYDILKGTKTINNLISLVTTTGLMGLIFVILSFIGDSNFITNYLRYGKTLGVSSALIDKILTIPNYYKKLCHGISGTYYTPNIKVYLIIFTLLFVTSLLYLIIHNIYKLSRNKPILFNCNIMKLIICILGVNIGFIIIGRYNQTNIIFIFPFFYLLAFTLIQKLYKYNKRFTLSLIAILIILTSYASFIEIYPYTTYNYQYYLSQLKSIEPKAKTLGNLNTEFYFENGALLDYRNLTHLEENNLTFSDYIRENNIIYIIYSEELDYIHRNQQWTILYGDDYYYEEMHRFIADNCILIHKFHSPIYGIRIPRYMFDYEWEVKIYRVTL